MLQNNQPMPSFEVYDHSLALEFYANVLSNVSPYSDFPIYQLIGHRDQAPPEVQRVAINEMELKRFLCRFPSIFTVTENNCVRLVKTFAGNKKSREETKFKTESSDVAVQYYVNAIIKNLTNNNRKFISLESLLGYRSQAPPDVQKRARNIGELRSFLINNPENFILERGRFVALRKSSSDTDGKIMRKNYAPKSKFNDNDSSSAVEFYSNVLYNVSQYSDFPLYQLIGHRHQASPEVQRVAINEMELKCFLARYPSIFTVTENNCVRLVKTIADRGIPREKSKCKTESSNDFGKNNGQNCVLKPNCDDNDSTLAVEYYSNILYMTGSNYPIYRLIGHRRQAPEKVKNVAFSAADLKLFLSKFPNIFSISGKSVTLKKVAPAFDSPKENCNVESESKKVTPARDSLKELCNVKSENSPAKFNPDIAAQFYAEILMRRGCYGKELPIHTLTGYRSHAPLEIQNCAKNTRELGILFSNYSKAFIVTPNKGVILIENSLNNIVHDVQNLSLESSDNKCNFTKAIEYYVNILRHKVSHSEFPITNLMVYVNEAPADVRKEASDEKELITFFLKHPDIFTVVKNKFVRLVDTSINCNNIAQNTKLKPTESIRNLNINKSRSRLNYFLSLEYPENHEFSGTWEDHVLDNTVLVTEEDECIEACEVIKKETIIALDCEGYNLGRGIISLIQIALINGTVYIFDIYELPRMISLGLKEIIESESILKVINHCRNDCINLRGQYDVKLKYIFDVAVAYHVIEYKMMSLSNFKPAGFNQICSKYGVPTNTCKDDLKFIYITQPNYWLMRPLNIKMVSYAAFDVASLVPYLYCEFLKRMDEETEYAIWRLSQRMCITS